MAAPQQPAPQKRVQVVKQKQVTKRTPPALDQRSPSGKPMPN